jgi:hypothetical protein
MFNITLCASPCAWVVMGKIAPLMSSLEHSFCVTTMLSLVLQPLGGITCSAADCSVRCRSHMGRQCG